MKRLIYTTLIDVRWGDMDAMGHVNNTLYFRYMEQGRISALEHTGIAFDGAGCGMILVHAECNFRIPIVYPARVEARVYCGEPGRSSLPLFIELVDANQPGTLYADGKSVMAWIDFSANKSLPIPDAVRARIHAMSAAQEQR